MYEFNAEQYMRVMRIMGALEGVYEMASPQFGHDKLDEVRAQREIDVLAQLRLLLLEIELSVAAGFVDLALDCVKDSKTQRQIHDCHIQIQNAIQVELKRKLFLGLSGSEAAFYAPKAPLFGQKIEVQFPSISDEIVEAGKCYALSRSTASVFHSIRCLEAGIRAMSRCLGVPDPTRGSDRGWDKMLKVIKGEIDKRWPNSGNRMSGDGQMFDAIHGSLAAMQNPYRNATMHLDQKYTSEEALHIFEVVKGLMTKIASRMDESGQPLA